MYIVTFVLWALWLTASMLIVAFDATTHVQWIDILSTPVLVLALLITLWQGAKSEQKRLGKIGAGLQEAKAFFALSIVGIFILLFEYLLNVDLNQPGSDMRISDYTTIVSWLLMLIALGLFDKWGPTNRDIY